MLFKSRHMRKQLDNEAHPLLKKMAEDFMLMSYEMGIEPVVTRVTDPVAGDSGVHGAGRGIDFRSEFPHGVFNYDEYQVKKIVDSLNEKYPRFDGKKTCIHHSFKEGHPFHFHIQVASRANVYKRPEKIAVSTKKAKAIKRKPRVSKKP